MEEIGDELLVRMKADKRNPLAPAVRDFDFSSVEAMLIATTSMEITAFVTPMQSLLREPMKSTQANG
jgi:hypothetical protein